MLGALTAPEATLLAAGVAAVTSLLTAVIFRYFVDARLLLRKAETEYRYEQRKVLAQSIGRYKGKLLDAAENLHYRMINLYDAADAGKLPAADEYFYRSTVFRFLAFFRLAVGLEREALYLDPRVADAQDQLVLRYVKALRWTMTDRKLADDEHFRTDNLRALCDITVPEGEAFDYRYFEAHVLWQTPYDPLFSYFVGLSPDDTPARWDRLVAMHLLLMAFMSSTGWDEMHQIAHREMCRAVRQLHDPERRELIRWRLIPEMKLDTDPQARRVVLATQIA